MTNPANDDEALVKRVAFAFCKDALCSCDGPNDCLNGGENWEMEARAAIAAVRAHDEQRGMVLVPREPTPAMLNAGQESMADGCVIHSGWCWDAMIAAAKPDGDAARDMTAAERLRMERETKAVHRAFDGVFAPRHSQWKGDK